MGSLLQISGARYSNWTSSEYLDHFGVSKPPFAAPAAGEKFWLGQSLTDLRDLLSREISRPGMLVISEPESELVSPVTELIRESLHEDSVAAILDDLPQLPEQFLLEVLTEFGFESIEPDLSECRSVIQAFVSHSAHAGTPPVIVVRRPESASEAVLDEIGRLMNLRENSESCVRLILLGKPESINIGNLRFTDLSIEYLELESLDADAVDEFILERIKSSGGKGKSVFTDAAMRHIGQVAGGVPGLISQLCAHAMSSAFAQEMPKVTKPLLLKALKTFNFALPEPSVEELVVKCISTGRPGDDLAKHSAAAVNHPMETPPAPQARPEARPYFDMSRNGKHIARFSLRSGRLLIGRHKSNEIYVPSNGVSLFHAVVICNKNEAYIFDLRSTNGTVVNGRDVARKRLCKGDVVSLGSLQLAYFPGMPSSADNVTAMENYTETVVLEEDDASEPTVYIRSGV